MLCSNRPLHFCRFFTPTINYLTMRGHNIHILCLSIGNTLSSIYNFVSAFFKLVCTGLLIFSLFSFINLHVAYTINLFTNLECGGQTVSLNIPLKQDGSFYVSTTLNYKQRSFRYMTTDKLVDIYSKSEVLICYENYLTPLNWFWQLSYFNNLFLTALKFFRDNEA